MTKSSTVKYIVAVTIKNNATFCDFFITHTTHNSTSAAITTATTAATINDHYYQKKALVLLSRLF